MATRTEGLGPVTATVVKPVQGLARAPKPPPPPEPRGGGGGGGEGRREGGEGRGGDKVRIGSTLHPTQQIGEERGSCSKAGGMRIRVIAAERVKWLVRMYWFGTTTGGFR